MANIRSKLADWLVRMVYRDPSMRSAIELPKAVFDDQKAKLEALQNQLRQRDERHAQLKLRIKKNRRQHEGRKLKIRQLEDSLFLEKQQTKKLQQQLTESQFQNDGKLTRPGLAWERRNWKDRRISGLAWKLRFWAWRREMRLGVLFQYDGRPLKWDRLPESMTAPESKTWPVISVVTPSYNQAEFLERTLISVLDQGYPKLEYVVMDGGSSDGSKAILEHYGPRLLHWQSAPDDGQSASILEGFQKTSGEIMAWLNSDDVWAPGTLQFIAEYFVHHPEVDAVYGHRMLIDATDRDVGRWILPKHDVEFTKWADYIPQETLFWRRSAYEKAGGVDGKFRFSMDWDLILRLQRTGANLVRLPWILGGFRVHAAQKSQTQLHTIAVEENARLRKRELGDSFTEDRLEEKVILFQAKAALTDHLLQLGIRR